MGCVVRTFLAAFLAVFLGACAQVPADYLAVCEVDSDCSSGQMCAIAPGSAYYSCVPSCAQDCAELPLEGAYCALVSVDRGRAVAGGCLVACEFSSQCPSSSRCLDTMCINDTADGVEPCRICVRWEGS